MRPSNGFTLIELMIVIAIIGILAAIAIPQYRAFMEGEVSEEQQLQEEADELWEYVPLPNNNTPLD